MRRRRAARAALVLLAAALASSCAPRPEPRRAADGPPADGPPADGPAADGPAVELAGRLGVDGIGEGAFGLVVHLVFRDADGAALGGPAARDTLDERGRFELSARAPSGAAEALVVGGTRAEALRLVPTPAGGIRLGGDASLPLSTALRLDLTRAGLGDPIRADLSGTLPQRWGIPVRALTLSREYVMALYGGAPPFQLPPVRVEVSDRGGYVFQPVDLDSGWGPEIEVNASGRSYTRSVLAHEYGHYVSYRMWGSNPLRYGLRARELREGWATFFSFAARAYGAARYGDEDLASSNPERAAFTDRITGGARYRGIVYGSRRPRRAAIASLLWSLYDGADATPFEPGGSLAEARGPGEGDNDDLALGRLVADAVRTTRASAVDAAGIDAVLAELKRRTEPELHASIDGAASFFLCPPVLDCDPTAAFGSGPDAPTRTLRPVAPADLRVRVERRGSGPRVVLTWRRRTVDAPWGNVPDRYVIRRDGAAVAERPGTAARAELDLAALGPPETGLAGAVGTWSVEAVSAGGGASAGAPTATLTAEPAHADG